MNMMLVNWLLKKQSTVETSVFGAEFIVMDIVVEAICVLRCRFCIIRVSLDGPAFVCGNNMSGIHNAQ